MLHARCRECGRSLGVLGFLGVGRRDLMVFEWRIDPNMRMMKKSTFAAVCFSKGKIIILCSLVSVTSSRDVS
jgi:hypothetical protein